MGDLKKMEERQTPKGKRVLWLDAEPMGCDGTRALLARSGFEVDVVANRREAEDFSKGREYGFLIVEPHPDYRRKSDQKAVALRSFMADMSSRAEVIVASSQNKEWLADADIREGEHFGCFFEKPYCRELAEYIESRVGS
ncbi:hypothetical protein CMI41_00360 [Candidatus Pacearchaeota archaeon]|nr:hypothetical protein [Candidatus Pacearchaeota archaeon]|tara:strand:- start:21226 stop:21645 length:420 start_codon:yes stop_codon:yes gene_type:complete